MARLVKRGERGLETIATIPPHLVGKVESEKELKAALKANPAPAKSDGDGDSGGGDSKGGPAVPKELAALEGDELAARYEKEFGRKPGNRNADTQREEIAAHLAEE